MALIAAFGVAVVATPLAMWLATRIGFVNEPGPLKVHARPIPYLGGLAVLLALIGPVVSARPSLLVPLVLAALLGLADDATDVPPALRIGAELVIGLAAAWVAAPHSLGYAALGVVVVVVLVNAVNFLDGLDGLASSVAALGALGSFVVLSEWSETLAIALVGALIGFLVWNAPPAKVHLGDSGSYLIGTALALLFLAAAPNHAPDVSAAFLFVGVPVADSAVAIVRRLRAHRPVMQGDRGHVYDQLVDRGWSANRAVVACAVAQAALTAIGIGVANLSGGAAVAVTAVTIAVVGAGALLAFTSPRAWTPER
jgi:UDP-N-acetylmuramyl pentapeptide phosphotransferase/UDP-N-acetylglucosamine-1-phosphate transferase